MKEQIEQEAKKLIDSGFKLVDIDGVPDTDEILRLSKYVLAERIRARLEEQDHESNLSWDENRIKELQSQLKELDGA